MANQITITTKYLDGTASLSLVIDEDSFLYITRKSSVLSGTRLMEELLIKPDY